MAGIATVTLVISIGARFVTTPVPTAPPRTPVVASRPAPDISNLTPRERADRLFERIMIAEEGGFADTVNFFIPMALEAYRLVGPLDADARYHVGLIHALSGDLDAVQAQIDSLAQANSRHLLGSMLAFTLSRLRDEADGMLAAYASFLEHYEAEIASGRNEYDAHMRALDAFRREAVQATGSTGGAGTAGQGR